MVNELVQERVTAQYPTLADPAAAQAAAAALKDIIQSHGNDNDRNRVVSPEVIEAIRQTGLFGVVGAKAYGGSEAGIEGLLRATIEIAAACGSTGWVFGVLAGHSWMLNLFPAEAQAEVTSVPGALTATVFRLGGEAQETADGYRITGGYGRFCSGVDHADWVLVGMTVTLLDGSKQPRFLLVPKTDIVVVDDWFTLGMRATGSRSIEIADAFVPAHRSVSLGEMLTGTTPGAQIHDKPIYRLSFSDVTPFSIVGAPLGMARAAVAQFAEEQRARFAENGEGPYQDGMFLRLSRAATAVEAAINLVIGSAAKIDSITDPAEFDAVARQELPRNWAWAVQTCRDVVNDLFAAAGGSVIYDKSPMQRIWRDLNAASQHVGFTEDKAMIDFGRVFCGLKPEVFVLAKAKRS